MNQRFYAEKIKAFIPSEKQDDVSIELHSMMNMLHEKELIIKTLESQVLEYENESLQQIFLDEEFDKEKCEHEIAKYRKEIAKLKSKVIDLEDTVKIKETTIEILDGDLEYVKYQAEKDRVTIEKLTADQEKLLNDLAVERELVKSMLQTQKEVENRLQSAEKETLFQKECAAKSKKDKEILLEKQEHLQKLAAEDEDLLKSEKPLENAEIRKHQKSEEEAKILINSLRYQLELNNRTWEKKFAILKQSLHAIKDEMFVRQTLQRQAANLNRVSISYAVCKGNFIMYLLKA
ncbi:uncharacterized protein C10orf67, mitochondrial-like [Rhinatrema bivittatum]|uniref:uncharacterized protein C10orf67, mitochondrial-like n=1 Tax=Rhinatrema bivittatum TaxID=194408 RepID=UPI00112B0148|nr:uncharacterized protein C10orf67, mitochondrial-like [Rhinatrema bivittatum]